jgi:hypothetical protein
MRRKVKNAVPLMFDGGEKCSVIFNCLASFDVRVQYMNLCVLHGVELNQQIN